MRISDWSSDVFSSDLGPGSLLVLSLVNDECFRSAVDHFALFRSQSIRSDEGYVRIGTAPTTSISPSVRLTALPCDLALVCSCVQSEVMMQAEHRDRSEEHTSELQSLMRISYAV